MNHLSIDEMIEYVSATDLSKEGIEFIAEKNIHLAKCKECSRKVEALQAIYDELITLGEDTLEEIREEFEKQIYKNSDELSL